jgi:hypothetical protein
MVRLRKSTSFGPFRVTASKSGLSLSGGVRGARASVNTKGRVRRTVGIPGTGVYDTKQIGTSRRRSDRKARSAAAGGATRVEMSVVDATDGRRNLFSGDEGVATAKIVGVSGKVAHAAAYVGIQRNQKGMVRGIREAVLTPKGSEYSLILMVYPKDNPVLFRKKWLQPPDESPRALPFGRLAKADARKWSKAFAGRSIGVVVFLDAMPGMEHAEVRFLPKKL